jgi:tetratricopeptide (TPR) repeat protein
MHYQAQMTAQNTRQLAEQQAAFYQRAEELAREVVGRLDRSNALLQTLCGEIEQLHAAVQVGFQAIAERLFQQQQVLEQIADILRRPYETKALELLQRAVSALRDGMNTSGRDQVEWFKDAMHLLDEVLNNPVGKQNYVAWFQFGWLHWYFTRDIPAAEEAFYRAARLSAPQRDLYHVNSLRHQACMQYFQGKLAEAYTTVHKALPLAPNDHDVMYDTARYAARTGREGEALQLLDRCIDVQPPTIVVMFSEEDFVS